MLEGLSGHEHIASVGLILEEIAGELVEVFLFDLLHAELASILNDLLVLAYHLPDLYHHCVILQFLTVLLEVQQERCLRQVGQVDILASQLCDFGGLGELFI